MNEAEAIGALTETGKPLLDERGHLLEYGDTFGIEPEPLAPVAPVAVAAYAAIEIPDQAFEIGRPLPATRMAVHPRGNRTQVFERLDQVVCLRFTSLDERKHDDEALFVEHRGRNSPDEFAIAGRYRLRRLDTGLFLERLHPGEFGAHRVAGVIAGPVDTQDERLRGSRIVDAIGRVFRDVEQRQARLRRYIPVEHRARRDLAKMSDTLGFTQ